jgi:serine/threonine protein kinase/Flp pilus assembly protein TadD
MHGEFEQLKEIFLAAVEKADVPQREAYLRDACVGDPALRRRVDDLLRQQERAGSFLESPAPALVDTVAEPGAGERPGTQVNRYRLLEPLGEGGFGIVFRAEQQQPVRRLVALKVLKPGMDTRQIIGRFEAERQALALMDHPNIARVLHGGETASGRPYFVMELVPGVPITDYCDQQRLPLRERLELFVTVCQAVQHAHQKGITHRDLKPSNVLVAADGGVPAAKVIDFGIAKALGQRLTDITVSTGIAQLVGTPLYMSPEQADLGGLDIDTRSDIYSLGVLLYELLTGTTPFAKERLQRAGFDEMRRIIREEEPPTPSTQVNSLDEATAEVAARRQSVPKWLRQLCRGELDWIVMKALEKDRNRRYEKASALAADVQHYLDDEPVVAGPPSAWYRFSKFARRNRAVLAVTAAMLLLVALAAGSLGWALRDRSLRREEAVQEAVKARDDIDRLRKQGQWTAALAVAQRAEALLAGSDSDLHHQFSNLCRDLVMAALLEGIRLSTEVRGELVNLPPAERKYAKYAQAFHEYGIDVQRLEPLDAGQQLRVRFIAEELAEALDNWASVLDKSDKATASRLRRIARAADPDPFRNKLRDALEKGDRDALKELAGSATVATLPASTLALLARALIDVQGQESAIALLRQVQIQHPDDFWINYDLGFQLLNARPPHVEEAARFYAMAMCLRPQSPDAAHNLGVALTAQGKLSEAIIVFRRAIQLKPDSAFAHYNLGITFTQLHKWANAVEEFRRATELKPGWAEARCKLGRALSRRGKLAEAQAHLEEAIRLDPNLAEAHCNLGCVLLDLGKPREADAAFRKALRLKPTLANAQSGLGWTLSELHRFPEARAAFSEAIRLDPQHANAHHGLGAILCGHDHDCDGAIREFREAIRLDPNLADAHSRLGAILCDHDHDCDGAIREFREAIALDPHTAEFHFNLGVALTKRGTLGDAESECRLAIRLKSNFPEAHNQLGYVLYKQNRLADAVNEYDQATQLKPDFASAHFNAGLLNAQLGRWDQTAAHLERYVELDPANHLGWYKSAALQLYRGNREGYRRTYDAMLKRFGHTDDPVFAARTAQTRLLIPNAVGDLLLVSKLADQALPRGTIWESDRWHQLLKALAEYRTGHYAGAVAQLQRVAPKAEGGNLDASALSVLAMAQELQGHAQEARAALAQAQAILARKMPDPAHGQPFGDDWHDWLHSQILCCEAEEVLNAKNRRAGAIKPPVLAPGH